MEILSLMVVTLYKDKNCHVTVVLRKNVIVGLAGTKKKKKCGRRSTSWAANSQPGGSMCCDL
jgi:hypothetical protein